MGRKDRNAQVKLGRALTVMAIAFAVVIFIIAVCSYTPSLRGGEFNPGDKINVWVGQKIVVHMDDGDRVFTAGPVYLTGPTGCYIEGSGVKQLVHCEDSNGNPHLVLTMRVYISSSGKSEDNRIEFATVGEFPITTVR